MKIFRALRDFVNYAFMHSYGNSDRRYGMEIQEKAGERSLILAFSGEMDHHGVRDTLRRMELAIEAALPSGECGF